MLSTKIKPLNVFKRKFSLLPKHRYGTNAIKDPLTKEVVGIEVTRFWLNHYWTKYVLNPQRQIVEVILTDDEYFSQNFAPKLLKYLYVRYDNIEQVMNVELQEKAKLFCAKGMSPEDFYTILCEESPADYWKKKFTQYASGTILRVSTPYSGLQLANAAYTYFCSSDYVDPAISCDHLKSLMDNKKIRMQEDSSVVPSKWILV